jgi:5-methyltetrahydropteroyltriglutamate--homocysteine methyltransferase
LFETHQIGALARWLGYLIAGKPTLIVEPLPGNTNMLGAKLLLAFVPAMNIADRGLDIDGRQRIFVVQDRHYKSVPERMFALADAFNQEYHELADAGCPVIQIEEPQIHLIAVRNIVDAVINPKLMVEVFNRTVKGLRAKTEVWAHSCWGNPSQQRMFDKVQSYKPALDAYNTVDADVITFESSSSGGIDLEAIGKTITEKKISIGVIDHHTLQVEQPEQVAAQIRAALKHIPAERLMISTDCGMGREGMSRRHAFYKTVALVLGTNIVRKELGVPQATVLAADERYSLVVPTK